MIKWNEFLMPYEIAVNELKNKFKGIRDEYRKYNEHSPIEFVVGRVKQIPSIVEKANKMGLSDDDIDQMDDIGGVRIICQFVDDIYTVVEMIRARDGMDMEIVMEKDYVKDVKQSGYRSYHMIIRYPIFTTRGLKLVYVEIQIRTMAMNFWATVEHSLRYKYKEELPEEVAEKLRSTALEVYELDKNMQEIRDEIMSAQNLFMHKSNIVSSILSGISSLEKMERQSDAVKFRQQFDQISREGNSNMDEKLEALYDRIKSALSIEKETLMEQFERTNGNV